MNLNNRLKRLEAGNGIEVDGPDSPWLAVADILGQLDAIFWPARHGSGPGLHRPAVLVAIDERRQRYRASGLEWGGTSDVSRMSRMRERQALERAGLVEIVSDGTRSGVYLKLPVQVEDKCRALCGLAPLRAARYLALRLPTLVDDSGYCRDGDWVCEFRVFSWEETAVDGDTVNDCWGMTAPLLTCGAVESHSTTVGHMFFRRTDRPMPESVEHDVAVVDAVKDAYYAAFDATITARRNWQPDDVNEVWVALSASR